jgi:chorismate-pyruvate lyase
MTAALKSINPNFTVTILKSGMSQEISQSKKINTHQGMSKQHKNQAESEYYERNIVLNLNNVPVLVATSQTLLSNAIFLDILQNSGTQPIGNRLFAPDSSIKRDPTMSIRKVCIVDIDNIILQDYLLSLNYNKNDTLIMRKSYFYYKKEALQLIEFILPTISQFIY